MGQKNLKGTVSISNADKRIRLRWRYQNERYSLNLSHYNAVNLHNAKEIALQIEKDIINNSLDVSLNKYRLLAATNKLQGQTTKQQESRVHKPAEIPVKDKVEDVNIVQLFEHWSKDYRQMDCEINVHYNALRNLLKKWKGLNEQNIFSKLNTETFGAKTYNERLAMLNSFSKWMVKRQFWYSNPFEDVARKKIKRNTNPNRKPFTAEEIRRILFAIKNDEFCPK